jgi:hypothetical protein
MARDAMNGMLVYCEKPEQTLQTFKRALGLHNPTNERPPGIDVASLDQFRREVARELELEFPYQGDPNIVWISTLAGGKSRDV